MCLPLIYCRFTCLFINPLRPTGPFLALKLIIIIIILLISNNNNFNEIFKFSIFQSVVLMFLYAEQDVNLAWHTCLEVLKIEK